MMKITMPQIVKKLSCLLLTLTAAVTLHAQNDDRAFAAGIDSIISDKTLDYIVVDRIVDEIFEKHGKSAYLAYRIAKSYYQYIEIEENRKVDRAFAKNDTTRAFKYINVAISVDPKYAAPYVLASDIISWEKRPKGTEEAMEWLNRGIAQNPKDSSLYINSALLLAYVNADAAVAKLQELKKYDSSFPVDLYLGRLYWRIFQHGGVEPYREMAEAYGKADINIMDKSDLGAYAFSLYATARYSEQYEVAKYGVNKYPDDYGLNMYLLSGANSTSHFDDAFLAFKKMQQLDSARVSALDYLRYGEALVGTKQYDEAIKQYEFVLSMEGAPERDKERATSHIETAYEKHANDFIKNGDYQEAINMYEILLDERRKTNKLTASMLSMYAGVCKSMAEKQNGQDKDNTYMKADDAYKEMGEKFPAYDDLAVFNRYHLRTLMDPAPEYPKGSIAKPFAEQLISLLMTKGSLTNNQQDRLLAAYWYLCYWNAVKGNNKKLCVDYAEKILAIDKNHSGAQRLKEMFGSKLGKRKK